MLNGAPCRSGDNRRNKVVVHLETGPHGGAMPNGVTRAVPDCAVHRL